MKWDLKDLITFLIFHHTAKTVSIPVYPQPVV